MRDLTTQSADLLSLALGMSGRVTSLIITEGRIGDAAVMASELEMLIDEIGSPPALEAELLMAVAFVQYVDCAFERALRTTDRLRAIRGAHADDVAPAASVAGAIRVMTGRRDEGMRDFQAAFDLTREVDPVAYAMVVGNLTDLVALGFDLADEQLVDRTGEALRLAESFGDAYGIAIARFAHGTALLRSGHPDPEAGRNLLKLSRAGGIDIGGSVTEAELAAATPPHARPDDQIDTLRSAFEAEIETGERLFAGYPLSVLVQLLVERRAQGDVAQAHDLVDHLERLTAGLDVPALELWPLQCHARLAEAVGDTTAYRRVVTRYRDLAEALDARGHIAIAKQLTADPSFAAATS